MRFSKQREAVFNVLCEMHNHPDVAQIYNEVRRVFPKISLATVYRNLSELVESGRAVRLSVDGCAERFDASTHNHAHFICTKCGTFFDVPSPEFSASCVVGSVARTEVTFYGVCENCQNTYSK